MVDGVWLQDHTGTIDSAAEAARATEHANGDRISVAVVDDLGYSEPDYSFRTALKRLDVALNLNISSNKDNIVLDFGNIVSELEEKNLKLLKVKDNNNLFVVDREGNLYGIETYYAGGYLDRFIGEKFVISFERMEQPTRDFEDWRKEFLDASWVKSFIERIVKKEYPNWKETSSKESLAQQIQSASTRIVESHSAVKFPIKELNPER